MHIRVIDKAGCSSGGLGRNGMLDKKRIFKCAIQKAIDNGWSHFVGEDEAHFQKTIELLKHI
jgi:hypothetical protein